MKNWKYINGAEGVSVGNAKDKNGKELRTGDDVSIKTDNPKLNKGTVVRINGETVEVQVWGTGGSVWTTPSRLVTKVGNAWTSQKEKRLDELARKGPSKMTRQEWEEFLRLEKESSLENQKFVKSLSKNSKTGNDSLTTSIEKGRLGLYNWYVHKNGSIVAGGTTDTESEAKLEAEKALKREKAGNKVGNKDIFSGNYVVVSEDGEVWFRDEHEQIGITKIDAWAQKRIAEYQRSIDEIKNGVKEAKKAYKDYAAKSKIGNELNTGDFFKRLATDAHKEETRDDEKLNENGIKRAYAAMKKTGNSVHNLFLKFPSYEEAEDYINTKLKNKYKSVKVISKPHNGNGTYEIIAED